MLTEFPGFPAYIPSLQSAPASWYIKVGFVAPDSRRKFSDQKSRGMDWPSMLPPPDPVQGAQVFHAMPGQLPVAESPLYLPATVNDG